MVEIWPVLFVILWGIGVALLQTTWLGLVPALSTCFVLAQITKGGKSPWR